MADYTSVLSLKFALSIGGKKSRFFAHHPRTEVRSGPRSLGMTAEVLLGILETGLSSCSSQLLRTLHSTHPANAAQAQDHPVQVAQVFCLDHEFDNRFAILVAYIDATDVGVVV